MGKFIVIYGRAEYSMSAKTLNDMFPDFVRYFKDRLYQILFGSNYVGKLNFKKKININIPFFLHQTLPPIYGLLTGRGLYAQLRNCMVLGKTIFIFQYLPFEEGGQLNQPHFSEHVWFKKVGGSGKDGRWTWKENLDVQTLTNSTVIMREKEYLMEISCF